MELYKTFSKLPLDRYEDYLSMIRNGDYRNIQADDVQDVRLLSYEHTITRNMANVEIPLQDGLQFYKRKCTIPSFLWLYTE